MEPKTDSDTIITSKLALATAGGSDGSGPKEVMAIDDHDPGDEDRG